MTPLTSRKETWPPSHDKKPLQSHQEPLRPSQQANEPEPYHVNETLLSNLTEIHTRALPYFGALLTSYESLKIGSISMDILRKVASGDQAEIEQKVYSDIQSNLDRLNIENELLLNKLRTGMDEPLQKFKQSVDINRGHLQRIQESQPEFELNLDNYSLIAGVLSVDMERIKEKCSTYLDTPEKQEFAKLVEMTLKNIDSIKTVLNRNGIKPVFGYSQTFEIVESAESQTIHFNKSILNKIIH